jgi:hypothetical protein
LALAKPALRRPADPRPGLHPHPPIAHDDIDHPADRVRAIDRRGAVGEDVHPLDGRQRQARDVGEIGHQAGPGDTTTVDQDEGRVGAQAPQVDARRAAGVVAGGVGANAAGPIAGRAGKRLGQGGQGVGDRAIPAAIDGLAA